MGRPKVPIQDNDRVKTPVRLGGDSTDNPFVEFTGKNLGLVKSSIAYKSTIGLSSHILLENTRKADFIS